jgi:hypothetical protein
MARLAAIEKGEYYPTPLERLDDILPHIRLAGDGLYRLFDPCCGEGRALDYLAKLLVAHNPHAEVQTWGIEISPERAKQAEKRLDRVICAPYQACAFYPSKLKSLTSLVLLNPPYDRDAKGNRLEHAFLERALSWMGEDALLIYIIPWKQLTWAVSALLNENSQDIEVYRFPDQAGPGGFEAFKQLVVLARYAPQGTDYSYDGIRVLYGKGYGAGEHGIVELPTQPQGHYVLPSAATTGRMRRRQYTSTEKLEACQDDPLYEEAVRQLYPASAEMSDPLRPPRDGHIAQMVAGGLTGTLVTGDTAFKGMVLKHQVVTPDPEDEGKEKVKDVYTTHVSRASSEGLEHFWTPNQVSGFLKEHADTFKQHILDTYTPYGNHAKAWEGKLLDTLSQDKRLPGREEAGLLSDQRQIAISLCRAVERYRVGHLVAMMGYGKSRTGLAAVDLMNAYPFLVVCPPHLVEGWVNEAEAAIPGLQGVIVESITELENVVAHYQPGGETLPPGKPGYDTVHKRWVKEGKPIEFRTSLERRWRVADPEKLENPTFVVQGDKLMVVIANSRAKLGPGWEAQFQYRYTLPRADKRTSAFRHAAAAYQEQRRNGYRPVDWDVAFHHKKPEVSKLRKAALEKAYRYSVCPECGLPLAEGGRFKSLKDVTRKPRICNHPRGRRIWDPDEMQWQHGTCTGVLYQSAPTITRRWPLVDYIRRKHPSFFRLGIVDEVHKHMAKGTDIGYVLQWMANLMPLITLTGTFFGGTASSIFYLLYRTQANVRRDFGFDDEKRWVERFGVYERTYQVSEEEYGAGNARRRRQLSCKERPGLSPEAVKYFLPTTAFAQVTDLGLAMPAYQEEIVDLPLGTIRDHISWFKGVTWSEMIANWPRWTSSWLQWNLARPNSAFRDEVMVMADGGEVELPAQIAPEELLPKEEWLVNLVKSELACNRKVIVYPRQTGTRDIRPRLKQILAAAGVRGISILDTSVPTRKRLKWLRKNARQVLITNPRLVETGLNLHDYGYCTIVFYEIEYSLYTLWQAMSRVWRPGQTKGVKVFFSEYRGTLEENALALIGQLYGESRKVKWRWDQELTQEVGCAS